MRKGKVLHVCCQAVRRVADHAGVLFVARLICSDVDCAELAHEGVASLDELDALACECGCTWELLAVSLAVDVAFAATVCT